MGPRVKMHMQYKKWMLTEKAKACGLDPSGTKLQLSERLAKYEDEFASRIWKGISDFTPREER